MGVSYNGSTAVSKTACVGSIPTTPAREDEWPKGFSSFLLGQRVRVR